jgi:hypothetical protein
MKQTCTCMCRVPSVAPRKRKRIGSAYAAWRVRTMAVSPDSQSGGYGFEPRTRYVGSGMTSWRQSIPRVSCRAVSQRAGWLVPLQGPIVYGLGSGVFTPGNGVRLSVGLRRLAARQDRYMDGKARHLDPA